MGFLDSTSVYTHTQYLHTRTCVFTRVHACMVNVASLVASYLLYSLSYNATVLVTLLFPYRDLAAHQRVEVESTSLIL